MNNGYKKTKFEWWYFHFISDISFNIIIHPTDMYGLNKSSYISVSILEKSGKGINFKQSFDLEKTNISSAELNIENNIFCIKKIGEEILINLTLENLKAKMKIGKIVIPELFNENSAILRNEVDKLSNNWLLVVPYSLYSGTLQYSDRNMRLNGQAYHDHNWGNWLIHECYDYWIWGNFQNINYAITYYYLFGVNGSKVKLLNIICQGKSYNLTDFDIVDLNDKIEITFYIESEKYSFYISNQNEFKSHIREIERKTIFYSRYSSNGKLYDLKSDSVECLNGINERIIKR